MNCPRRSFQLTMKINPILRGVALAIAILATTHEFAFASAAEKLMSRSITSIGGNPGVGNPHIVRTQLTAAERAETIGLTITLPLRNMGPLEARVANHQRLTIAELDAHYFPLQADYERVIDWFAKTGLSVTSRAPHRMSFTVSGTIDQVAAVLRTAFARVRTRDGEFTSAISAPTLPNVIAKGVLGIEGLQPHIRAHPNLIYSTNQQTSDQPDQHPPQYRNTAFNFLTGEDIRSIYHAPQELTGAGETIAILMGAPINRADVDAYNAYTNNPFTGTFDEIDVGTRASGSNDNYALVSEAYLDVEAAESIAPSANVRLYSITDLSDASTLNGMSRILTDVRNGIPVTVLSMSFGIGELAAPASYIDSMHNDFLALSALGVTCIASSGDLGYLEKGGVDETQYPASDPMVTGVGGTTIQKLAGGVSGDTDNNVIIAPTYYIGESVFYQPYNGGFIASGGNVSQIYPRPAWQTGNGSVLAGQSFRCVPDVAGPWGYMTSHSSTPETSDNASGHSVFAIMYTNVDSSTGIGQFIIKSETGTSLAAPVWAGIVALVNQARGSAGPIGFLNPWLYEIGENTKWGAFMDLDGTFNNVLYDGTSYPRYDNWNGKYYEQPGYDLCTGLGTPNIANLVAALQSGIYVVQPSDQTVEPGSSVVFSAFAEISPYLIAPATYQWYRNGAVVSGGSSPQLMMSGSDTQIANSGDQYQCIVTLANNTTISTHVATLTVTQASNPGHVINLSSRANVQTGANILDGGFTISGAGSMPVLVRAIGPTLSSLGVSGVLGDPALSMFQGSNQIGYNYSWGGSATLSNAFSAVGAFGLPSGSADSALLFASGQGAPALASLNAGGYTGVIAGSSGDTGVGLFEVYDANPVVGSTWVMGMPYLSNISTRASVGTGDNILIGGFVLAGNTSRTLLIRASGPSLNTVFGIPGVLVDPRITLFNSSGTAFASNEVWNNNSLISSAADSVGAFGWEGNSNDSAILVTLPPGNYTAEVEGGAGDSGVALLEIYLLQ